MKLQEIPNKEIAILILPALAYTGCYVKEIAYADYFNIPHELVIVSASNVIELGALLAVALFTLFQVTWIMMMISDMSAHTRVSKVIHALIRRWGIPALIFVGLFLFSGYEISSIWKYWYLALMLLYDTIPPLILCKGKHYTEAFELWININNESNSVDNGSLMHNKQLKTVMFILAIAILPLVACHAIGHGLAVRKTYFGEINEELILSRYGDTLILCKYEPTTRTTTNQFRAINISSLSGSIDGVTIDNISIPEN